MIAKKLESFCRPQLVVCALPLRWLNNSQHKRAAWCGVHIMKLLKKIFSLFLYFFLWELLRLFPLLGHFFLSLTLTHTNSLTVLFCLLSWVELLWADKATFSLNCSDKMQIRISLIDNICADCLFKALVMGFTQKLLPLLDMIAVTTWLSQKFSDVCKCYQVYLCVLKTLDNYYLPAFKLWQGVTTHKFIWPNESVSTWFFWWLIVVSSGLAWIPLLLFIFRFAFSKT